MNLSFLHLPRPKHVPFRAKTNSEMIKSLLDPSRYDPTSRPGEGDYMDVTSLKPSISTSDDNTATNILVNMFIRNIRSVDIKNMEMGLQITFRSL